MTRQQAIKILRLLENQNPSIRGIHSAVLMAIKAIRREPVRCKDCKYWVGDDETATMYCNHGHEAINIMFGNWYCADGERRKK